MKTGLKTEQCEACRKGDGECGHRPGVAAAEHERKTEHSPDRSDHADPVRHLHMDVVIDGGEEISFHRTDLLASRFVSKTDERMVEMKKQVRCRHEGGEKSGEARP